MNPDEILSMNPFLSIIDTGGSNGEDDVAFRKILRTERFYVDLPNSGLFPKKDRTVYVIERIFEESYENIYISWFAEMADRSTQNPYKFIGTHETSHGVRREPDDLIYSHGITIPQSTIDAFRTAAALRLTNAQGKALSPPVPKRKLDTAFDGTPVNIMNL